jgi:four helix bundle suffix protein
MRGLRYDPPARNRVGRHRDSDPARAREFPDGDGVGGAALSVSALDAQSGKVWDDSMPAVGRDGNNEKHGKNSSQLPERLLPPRGDYQTLLSFQKAEIIYDLTFRFAHKYLAKTDRTVDQMIQSARSGKKNILEGSKAAITSKETEIKLTNVARASLEELLDDYRDFLRARDHKIWPKDSKEAQYVRKLGRRNPQTYEDYREFVDTRPAEVVANIALCLIHQTNYLLDQQLRRLEEDFVKAGGLRERMTRVRLQRRSKDAQQEP